MSNTINLHASTFLLHFQHPIASSDLINILAMAARILNYIPLWILNVPLNHLCINNWLCDCSYSIISKIYDEALTAKKTKIFKGSFLNLKWSFFWSIFLWTWKKSRKIKHGQPRLDTRKWLYYSLVTKQHFVLWSGLMPCCLPCPITDLIHHYGQGGLSIISLIFC